MLFIHHLFNIQRNFLQMTQKWSTFRELKTSKCSVPSGMFISNLYSQGSVVYENWECKDCKGQNEAVLSWHHMEDSFMNSLQMYNIAQTQNRHNPSMEERSWVGSPTPPLPKELLGLESHWKRWSQLSPTVWSGDHTSQPMIISGQLTQIGPPMG